MRLPPTDNVTHPATYENNGLLYGAFLGALVGVLIAGPHFADWSIEKILAAIAASSAVLGMTGYFVMSIIFAGLSEGLGQASFDNDDEPDSSSGADVIAD